ncbi:MAG: GNAT family N-acetyltransferase [Acidimicrobiia bacterium]
MPFGVGAAVEAWRRLAGADIDGQLQVVVDRASWLAPRGWIGIVTIGDTVTASVPRADLAEPVRRVLHVLEPAAAVRPDVVVPLLPVLGATLGPVALFHPPATFQVCPAAMEAAGSEEVREFLGVAAPDDLDESGVHRIESPAFASRTADGRVAAICGYRRWPNGVAHLSALTLPEFRGHGHGRTAASMAIAHAVAERLLPHWRARP